MMLKGRSYVFILRNIFITVHFFIACIQGSRSQGTNVTLSAAACYGNVNNYIRLECEGNTVIKVLEVYQGAKLKSSKCVTPASTETYNKMCCQPDKSDCRFKVDNVIGKLCDGNANCYHLAMWSRAGNQCDQDIYPLTITYNQAFYTCVPLVRTTRATTTTTAATTKERTSGMITFQPSDKGLNGDTHQLQAGNGRKTPNMNDVTTTSPNISLTSNVFSVVSHHDADEVMPKTTESDTDPIGMNDAIIVAVVSGILGMFFTLVIFIFYWRRKRRLRINGKPQATVWDYLLSQTFTVRGERGYDHFSSCRSSASSDGDPKSPVIRKNLWLPNISPMEDTQSDVFNDSESTNHKLEFRQLGSSNPYAFLTLGINNSPSGPQQDA